MNRGLAIAALAAAAFASAPADAKPGGAAGAAAAHARAAFAQDLRDAGSVLDEATRNLAAGIRSGALTRDAAAQGYAAAFCFYAARVVSRADAAADAFAQEASDAMALAGDPTLRGTLAGGGGAVDSLADALQASLDAARRGARAKAKRFERTLARGTARTRLHVTLPPWTLHPRAAPSAGGPVAAGDLPLDLVAAIAVRLDSGRVVAGLGGRAPASQDGDFDARLVDRTSVRAVGSFLAAGGMAVQEGGVWSAAVALNDPTQGAAVEPGNRSVQFGVDPFDGGLAGRQPGRLVQAGVIGIP